MTNLVATAPEEEALVAAHPELSVQADADSDDDSDFDVESELDLKPAGSVVPLKRDNPAIKLDKEKRAATLSLRRSDLSMKLSVERQNLTLIQVCYLLFRYSCSRYILIMNYSPQLILQAKFKCRCTGGNCIGAIGPVVATQFREQFWGAFSSPQYPSMSARRTQIRTLLDTAHLKGEVFRPRSFVFQISSFIVCENGFITMLGFNANDKPRMWREIKKRVLEGKLETTAETRLSLHINGMRLHARTFILAFIKRECDQLPNKLVAIVPYVYIRAFWADYEYACRLVLTSGKIGGAQIASYDTFKRAFLELKGKYL